MITMADLVLRPSRCAGLLVAICLCAPVYLAHAQGSRARADVAGLLKKHDEALKQHNLEGLLALYAPSPRTVTLGTGPGEKYQGKAEIKAAYTEIFKDFDKGTLRHSCYWKDGGGRGNTVWGAAMCKFSDAKGEKVSAASVSFLSTAVDISNGRARTTAAAMSRHYSVPCGRPAKDYGMTLLRLMQLGRGQGDDRQPFLSHSASDKQVQRGV